jgi:hypothetical protein
LKPPKAFLRSGIPRVDRYSQTRQTIVVPRGGKFGSLVSASRGNFGGPVVLETDQFPPGITVTAQPMSPNLNIMPVVFSAAPDAPLGGKLIDFKMRHADEKIKISGGFRNLADFVLGPPNNARYYGCTVDKLAVAIVDKLPFSLELVQPNVPIVRRGQMNLKVIVKRDEGFKQPITLQLPFRPPGVGTRNTVRIPADKNEAYYPINANGNAQIGKWPIYVLGSANVNGTAWISTQMITLEVAQPLVTVTMKRTSCERGQPAQIYCKFNKAVDFKGEATAQLLGLPAAVTAPTIKFSKDTPEITFDVTTTAKSPVGKHKSVFCRVIIPKNGESIMSTAGVVELQINRPIVKKKPPATKAPAEKPEIKKALAKKAPAKKPLSRLEQLRNKNKKNQD